MNLVIKNTLLSLKLVVAVVGSNFVLILMLESYLNSICTFVRVDLLVSSTPVAACHIKFTIAITTIDIYHYFSYVTEVLSSALLMESSCLCSN